MRCKMSCFNPHKKKVWSLSLSDAGAIAYKGSSNDTLRHPSVIRATLQRFACLR